MASASFTHDDPTRDPDAARTARLVQTLEALAEVGMAMAEGLRDRMAASTGHEAACELTLAFTRIARAVRLTVALEARLSDAQAVRDETLAAEAAEQRAAVVREREARVERAVIQVQDAVEMAIGEQTRDDDDDGDRAERLVDGLGEYLQDRRETESFANRPVSFIVAQVCRALGVAVDWELWKNEDWAIEEWRAKTPGSPYAQDVPPDEVRGAPVEAPTRGPPSRRLS